MLASDVRVGEPLTDDIDDPEDDIRFSLTAEAGRGARRGRPSGVG